jgi:NAD dependent epimerase/dehydratase family enzyme
MKDKKIIIAGGTWFIGRALAARWGKDNRIVILGRQVAGTGRFCFRYPHLEEALSSLKNSL